MTTAAFELNKITYYYSLTISVMLIELREVVPSFLMRSSTS